MTHAKKRMFFEAARPARVIFMMFALLAGSWRPAQGAVPPVQIAQSPLLHGVTGTSAVALSSARLAAGSTFLYQAGFESTRWSGTLKKFAISIAGDGSVQFASIPVWEAGDILSGHTNVPALPLPEQRKIYTSLPGIGSAMVEFRWDKLADSQKALLDASPLDGAADGLGMQRLEFLRGGRTREIGQPQGIFRLRAGALGDIVNSNMIHVGAPALEGSGADYLQFHEAHKSRTPAVYIGANDGMLHAFDAKDGVELFAFVPQSMFPALAQLSRPDYVHRPYVDGMIAVAEAQVQGKWKTVLAAGMGGGGQGVFALDVSDPADFGAGGGVLWEFTDRHDADMGNVVNIPLIARFRTKQSASVSEYRHFVAVASGVNNYLDDGYANALAPAVLFLLSLDKDPADPWQLGVNYFKFSKPILDTALQNGLSPPALVHGEDGAVRYAYAGDLQGNLWRFDFSGNAPWSKENTGTTPLFVARDEQQRRQPITTRPQVVFAPGGGYVVLFGTGKFMEQADTDPVGFSSQSFYGIYDALQGGYAVKERSQLASRTLSKAGEMLQFAGADFSYGTASANKRGWYFDFPGADSTGERSVSNPMVESGRLIFNSLMPCAAPCLEGGGRSYVLEVLTGLPIGKNTSGMISRLGMLAAPALLETSATAGNRNAFGKAVVKRKSAVIHAGSGGVKGSVAAGQGDADGGLANVGLPAMRFSWREILRWQELRMVAKSLAKTK
ncbi:PilC/PilY family type IV pilus protein [Janthinobacterium sp. 17J80-10]|uniref:pilus assembly protein n=1 Tax=Janthinobacterium sp. 17J80-10 TaxID=2497863 RepID=UPI0010059D50|nr:PilC/PilY family type IV pilus protein [Janthinobacterium sp. 17J80-10]QAU35237.1 pilus assembly protein PilY [Janthinobacterium sp. 17J80-10]